MLRILSLCLLSLICLACPFSRSRDSDLKPIGPAVRADLLIYFNSGVSADQLNTFIKNVLSRPHPEGRGDYNAPGIRTLLATRTIEGHEGIAVTFFPDATGQQRKELLKAITASPLVYKVLENEIPDNVSTLKGK